MYFLFPSPQNIFTPAHTHTHTDTQWGCFVNYWSPIVIYVFCHIVSAVLRVDWRGRKCGSCRAEGAKRRNWLQRRSSRNHTRYHCTNTSCTLVCVDCLSWLHLISCVCWRGSGVNGAKCKEAPYSFLSSEHKKASNNVIVFRSQWPAWTPACLTAPPRLSWSTLTEMKRRISTQRNSSVRRLPLYRTMQFIYSLVQLFPLWLFHSSND